MSKDITVSLIVPCRNESKHIAGFLSGLRGQTFSLAHLEVIFVDGMSDDDTVSQIEEHRKKYSDVNIKIIKNREKITPVAFNLGIKNSSGKYVLPTGAHSEMSKNYIQECVSVLEKEPTISCVGGTMETVVTRKGSVAQAIAISLSHPFGTGNARFRNRPKKASYVDTVFGGCYRREVFEKIGYYNDKLVRSQDLELNLRLIRSGGKILMIPNIFSKYYPKDNFKDIALYHFRCGLWVSRARKQAKVSYRLRHYLPLIVFTVGLMLFVGSFLSPLIMGTFIFLVVLYLALSISISLVVAITKNNLKLLLFLPMAFFLRHFGFGLGSFVGLVY